jgi:DNA polymerase I-like protein with 3'-5' exonuclease and polymerase domains
MAQPQKKKVFAKHFERLQDLRGELEIENSTRYTQYPTSADQEDTFNHKVIAMDLETTGLRAATGEIECVGASTSPGTGIVVGPDNRRAYEFLKRAEVDDSIMVIGQNWSNFDAYWIYKHWGLGLPARLFDTLLVAHLLDPDAPKKLAHLVHEYASPPIRGFWKTVTHYRDNKALVCIVDCDADLRVARGQEQKLEQENLLDAYWNEVLPVARTAFNMRVGGWHVNTDALGVAGRRVEAQVLKLRTDLPAWEPTKSTGIRSENQDDKVRDHLYQHLRLPVQFDRKSHNPTGGALARKELKLMLQTGHKDIEKLPSAVIKESIEFINLIDNLKDKSKLLTFLNPESVWLDKGKFHPCWDPTGTATFRFSCKDPNLQQVPKCGCKGPDGKKRNCYGTNPECLGARFPFLPDPGWKMASIDFSQVEVVGFLWSAGQWDILEKVLHEGLDAHEVMAEALGMPRDEAKNMTFALVYGASDQLIAAHSGKSLAEVAVARMHYLKTFPGVERFRTYHIEHAMKHGYVENPFGRRRYIWVRNKIGRAANQAANAPIQGIPPMVVRRAMVRLEKELPYESRLLGNIHDEILFTYPGEHEQEILDCANDVMRSPVPELQATPLGMASGLIFNTDVEVGTNWANLRGLEC